MSSAEDKKTDKNEQRPQDHRPNDQRSKDQPPPDQRPNDQKDNKKIVIEGVTHQGDTFRPSDWAERMSGTLATFKNRRIYYSPMLQPTTHVEGYKCILLDPKLKDSSPQVYQAILDFAKANHLRICNNDRSTDNETA